MAFDFSAYDDDTLFNAYEKHLLINPASTLILAIEKELENRTDPPIIKQDSHTLPVIETEAIDYIYKIKNNSRYLGHLTEFEKNEIVSLREKEFGYLEISERTHRSSRTIQRILSDALMVNFTDSTNLDQETISSIKRLSEEGKDFNEISNIHKIDKDVARRMVNKLISKSTANAA